LRTTQPSGSRFICRLAFWLTARCQHVSHSAWTQLRAGIDANHIVSLSETQTTVGTADATPGRCYFFSTSFLFTGTTFIPHDLRFSKTVTCDKFNGSDGSAMLLFKVCLAVKRSALPLARLLRFVLRSPLGTSTGFRNSDRLTVQLGVLMPPQPLNLSVPYRSEPV